MTDQLSMLLPVGINIACRPAVALSLAGRDDESEHFLIETRHHVLASGNQFDAAFVELAMAWTAILADRDDSARQYLGVAARSAPSDDIRFTGSLFLAESSLKRRCGDREIPLPPGLSEALDGVDSPELPAMLRLDRAQWCLIRRLPEEALELASQALSISTLCHESIQALANVVVSRALAARGLFAEAWQSLPPAIETFARLGLPRLQGRALACCALELVPHLDPAIAGTPASWLGRAAQALGEAATFRDRSLLNDGFRRYGRRIQDRAVSPGVLLRLDALDHSVARLRSLFGVAIAETDRALSLAPGAANALPQSVEHSRDNVLSLAAQARPLFADATRLSREIADVMGTAIANRERLRRLLIDLSEAGTLQDAPSLGAAAASLAARHLEADYAVVAWGPSADSIVEVGSSGDPSPASPPGHWRDAAAALVHGDADFPPESVTTRSNELPRGTSLAVSLRGHGFVGLLYADRARRSVQFRDSDFQLAQMIVRHLALAIERLAAFEASQRAARTLSVVLDTLQDGVLAVDGNGILTNLNQAAERLLSVEAPALIGKQLSGLAELAPIAALLSANRRLEGAVARLKNGVFVISARPVASDSDSGGVVATIAELDRVQRIVRRASTHRARYTFRDIIGQSPAFLEALRIAHQAVPVDASVLITGQSGTGKELFAQAIHNAGARASEPFIGVNCAAVPRDLLEAELFGYERGAFTGARSEGNAGRFELAGEGTILLDEIGDMPLDMQAKLLRVLQERTLVRLGGSTERPVKARVMATTHRDLDELVSAGKFRLDLLYRLRVIHVHVPPLASRGEDVVLLARTFLQRFADAQRKAVRDLSDEVLRQLTEHAWSGNVRELANVIEREVVFVPADAPKLMRLQGPLAPAGLDSSPDSTRPPSSASIVPLAEIERKAFLDALRLCAGNIPRAAAALGVSKVTFYAKLKGWGMHPKDRSSI